MDIGSQLKTGAFWVYLQGGIGGLFTFVAGVILARLLEPEDFGLFLAVSAYTSILLRQTQLGLPEALLQSSNDDRHSWDEVYWLMLGLGFALMILVFFLADTLARFYGEDDYSKLMRLMSVLFVITPYTTILATRIRRNMQFKVLSLISIKVTVFGTLISILGATAGLGAYALAISGMAGSALSLHFMYRHARWHPGPPRIGGAVRRLWAYGWRIHVNTSLNLVANRIDNMLAAKIVGTAGLGIYSRAFSLSRLPVSQILGKLYQLLFSSFARVQADLDHSKRLNRKVMCAVASAIFPILLTLIFVADGFVYYVYGEKWLPVALPLQIMAIGSFALVATMTLGALTDAQGLVGREIPLQALNVILTVIAVLVGGRWGVVGIAAGIAAKAYAIAVLQYVILARSHVCLNGRDLYEALGAPLFCVVLSTFSGIVALTLMREEITTTDFTYIVLIAPAVLGSYSLSWLIFAKLWKTNEALQSTSDLAYTFVRKMIR